MGEMYLIQNSKVTILVIISIAAMFDRITTQVLLSQLNIRKYFQMIQNIEPLQLFDVAGPEYCCVAKKLWFFLIN